MDIPYGFPLIVLLGAAHIFSCKTNKMIPLCGALLVKDIVLGTESQQQIIIFLLRRSYCARPFAMLYYVKYDSIIERSPSYGLSAQNSLRSHSGHHL